MTGKATMLRVGALMRHVLLNIPVAIVLGLVAIYLLFAWFAFEPLLKWAAPKFITDKSQHVLKIDAARFDPFALSVSIQGLKLDEPDGKPLLAFGELFVDLDATSLFKWTYSFDEIRLTAPNAQLELRKDGSHNWAALLDAFKSEEEPEDKPLPRLLIKRMVLEQGRAGISDLKMNFRTEFNPLALTLNNISTLPDDKGAYTFAAVTPWGARIRWKGEIALNPIKAAGELAIDQIALAKYWPYLRGHLALRPPEGIAGMTLNYRAGYADDTLSLTLDNLGFNLEVLALQGLQANSAAIKLNRIAIRGGRFDLAKRELNLAEMILDGGHIALQRDRNGRLDIEDWFVKTPTSAEPSSPNVEAVPTVSTHNSELPWRINLNQFNLNGLGIEFSDRGFAAPLRAEVGNLQIDFAAKAEAGGAQAQAMVNDLDIDVSGIRLFSGKSPEPIFVLGGIGLSEGSFDLAARRMTLGSVRLSNGKLDVVRDAQGEIALLNAFSRIPGNAIKQPLPHKPVRASANALPAEPAWRYQVGKVDLAGFQLGVRDESVQPRAELTLNNIQASIAGISENLKTALPVRLDVQVKQGGRLEAHGKVIPARPAAEVKFKLNTLALQPVQPYLSQAANLVLASGHLSTQGLVKFQAASQAGSTPKVDFRGGFDIANLRLNEVEGDTLFLSWNRLGSDNVSANLSALNIEELRLHQLDAKLIIFKDQSVNLKRILKAAPVNPETDPAKASPDKTDPNAVPPAPDPNAFRVAIDRVRIVSSALDFADYSLALPFGTRIHYLRGAFDGISSQPGSVAALEIDGQVDEFGLARAVGQVDLFDPTGYMDIKTVFRNVEMANLTPYSATFAGRKINSGKLSLDLEYTIKQRQLLGENQLIMDKLTLGERVESPAAKNLPLDLAIAILQDSDGRIDLGLPVSGSLDDPQFSYGQIIWKAIGNVLTKIVTAPFRALGALFGGGGEKLEQIAFEAGSDALTPPEKEKFKQVSQILNKRPGLALTVVGAWSAEMDRPVLKENQLRRAIAERMGVKLADGEDAGPISTANPKHQAALEGLYAQRFGEADWTMLSAQWRQANPDKKAETGAGKLMSRLSGLLKKKDAPLSADQLARLKDADLHVLLYQRLLEKEAVTDAALRALAQRRSDAVVQGLVAAGAPAERIGLSEAHEIDAGGREVQVKLDLGVVKKQGF